MLNLFIYLFICENLESVDVCVRARIYIYITILRHVCLNVDFVCAITQYDVVVFVQLTIWCNNESEFLHPHEKRTYISCVDSRIF